MKQRVLAKTVSFHTLLKKQSSKRCCFERQCRLSSSPGRAENRGRRKFCSPVFTDFSSSKKLKKTPTKDTHLLSWPVASHVLEKWRRRASSGSRGAVAQWPPRPYVSPVFSYKYRGDEESRSESREERKRREKREKSWREGKKKKTERGREKENKNEKKKQRKRKKKKQRKRKKKKTEDVLSFLPLPYRTCTVHVFAGEVKLVTVSWCGLGSWILGWVQSSPAKKKYFLYFVISSVLYYAIFFNYRSVFYVVKNTNPVLKYPVFVNLKNLKKYFCAYGQVSQS